MVFLVGSRWFVYFILPPQRVFFAMNTNSFFGFKQSQVQEFTDKGIRVPVTWVKANPMTIIRKDVASVLVSVGEKKRVNKPILGILQNLTEKVMPRFLRTLKATEFVEQDNLGSKMAISDVFQVGDRVKVEGVSKGKGFAGVMKRHGFKGGPKTHGQSVRPRHPGSIGQTTTPGRVYKGKRMAGHMGSNKVSILGLSIFAIKPEENLIGIKGLIPGYVGGLIKITKSKR